MVIIIICLAAIYLLYKGITTADKYLNANHQDDIQIREPKEEAEKEAASIALKVYGSDPKLPILVYKQSPESKTRGTRILLLFVLYVAAVIVIACGLIAFLG